MAAGAVVVSLCSTSDETIEEAEKDLPRNLCPLIKSSYGFGKTDKCPYFYFSDLVVGETTCDGKKKMYEYMAEFKPVHVMQLPNRADDEASRTLWRSEIVRFKELLEQHFGKPISEQALRDAIVLKNRERRALADFYRLGQLNPPALSGTDLLKVVYGATFRFDKEQLISELQEMTRRIKAEYAEGKRLDTRPRILITGCPIGGAADKVVRLIEEHGGWVVGYENCTGAKATEQCVSEQGDPFDALTDKYLAIGCSCISPQPPAHESAEPDGGGVSGRRGDRCDPAGLPHLCSGVARHQASRTRTPWHPLHGGRDRLLQRRQGATGDPAGRLYRNAVRRRRVTLHRD